MTEYLSIDDVIVWAQEELGRSVSKGRIMNLLLDERISVHFSAEVDLHGVAIHQPNGRLETIKVPVPFKGVLKALTPPSNTDCLTASLVEVAFVRGKGFRLEQQATVAGCELPTEEEHGGCILPGYGVEAILDFALIPRGEWLICTDDLRALFEERGEVNGSIPKKGVLASGGRMDETVQSSPIESRAFGGRCLKVGYDQGGSTKPPGTAAVLVQEEARPDNSDVSTDRLVSWQRALFECWPQIVASYAEKLSPRNAMLWLKKNGPRDVIPEHQPSLESMQWIAEASDGAVHTVTLKTIRNVIAAWRAAGQPPAQK